MAFSVRLTAANTVFLCCFCMNPEFEMNGGLAQFKARHIRVREEGILLRTKENAQIRKYVSKKERKKTRKDEEDV